MRLRLALLGLCVSLLAIVAAPSALADASSLTYYQAKIVAAGAEPGSWTVRYLDGPHTGQTVSGQTTGLNSYADITLPTYHVGDDVIVAVSPIQLGTPVVSIVDHYRLPFALIILAVAIGLAILFAGWRGIGSAAGLLISLVVITAYTIPQILHGASPYTVAFVSCFVIALIGIYLAHGFSPRTTIALVSTYLTLGVAALATAVSLGISQLNGISGEDISYLHQQLPALNIQGLLFAGIMIGVLGVLDDITVGQAAAVDELRKANPKLGTRQLYARALSIGREHIASLINTLVLAYVGTSFIFIMYVAAVQNLPLWITLNSELVSEEIIRSLLGSIALILAVPIATLLSAYFLPRIASYKFKRLRAMPRVWAALLGR
jgi:uncharacterized membrane protein